jgi:hypothetical protein
MTPEQRQEFEAEIKSLYVDGMVRIVVRPTWAKLIDFDHTPSGHPRAGRPARGAGGRLKRRAATACQQRRDRPVVRLAKGQARNSHNGTKISAWPGNRAGPSSAATRRYDVRRPLVRIAARPVVQPCESSLGPVALPRDDPNVSEWLGR